MSAGPDWERFGLVDERRVWAAWNALPDDCPAPVRTIAAALELEPVDVARIVYPPAVFGVWAEQQEPPVR
jgi:hypothetical protein